MARRGPALADLYGSGSGSTPGGNAAAARPEALRLTALQARNDAELALGAHADVLPRLQELTAEHPLHEPFRVQLLRALSACGRQADALAAYEDARRVLAERLGTDPGPELRALHTELLNADEKAAAPVHAPAPVASRVPEPAVVPRERRGNLRTRLTSFVGRERELRALQDDLAGARLITLTGPGGSGKTRLSEEMAAAVRDRHPDRYPDGAWIAELAPLEHPSAVPGAVLNALGGRATALYATPREVRTTDPADPAPASSSTAPAADCSLSSTTASTWSPPRPKSPRRCSPPARGHRSRHQPRAARYPRRSRTPRRAAATAHGPPAADRARHRRTPRIRPG